MLRTTATVPNDSFAGSLNLQMQSKRQDHNHTKHPLLPSPRHLSDSRVTSTSWVIRSALYSALMSILRQTRWLSFAAGVGAASAYYVSQKASLMFTAPLLSPWKVFSVASLTPLVPALTA